MKTKSARPVRGTARKTLWKQARTSANSGSTKQKGPRRAGQDRKEEMQFYFVNSRYASRRASGTEIPSAAALATRAVRSFSGTVSAGSIAEPTEGRPIVTSSCSFLWIFAAQSCGQDILPPPTLSTYTPVLLNSMIPQVPRWCFAGCSYICFDFHCVSIPSSSCVNCFKSIFAARHAVAVYCVSVINPPLRTRFYFEAVAGGAHNLKQTTAGLLLIYRQGCKGIAAQHIILSGCERVFADGLRPCNLFLTANQFGESARFCLLGGNPAGLCALFLFLLAVAFGANAALHPFFFAFAVAGRAIHLDSVGVAARVVDFVPSHTSSFLLVCLPLFDIINIHYFDKKVNTFFIFFLNIFSCNKINEIVGRAKEKGIIMDEQICKHCESNKLKTVVVVDKGVQYQLCENCKCIVQLYDFNGRKKKLNN